MKSKYPEALDPNKVGHYPAATKSGGGYFYDELLENWGRPLEGFCQEYRPIFPKKLNASLQKRQANSNISRLLPFCTLHFALMVAKSSHFAPDAHMD